jgi:hypothetical protein
MPSGIIKTMQSQNFPFLYSLYKRFQSAVVWFSHSPVYNGLIIFLLTPLLLPFAFLLGVYNTPPPFISMLLFNAIVEISFVYYVFYFLFSKKHYPYVTTIHILLIILFCVTGMASLLGFDGSLSFWGDIKRADGIWFLLHLYLYTFLLTWVITKKTQWENVIKGIGVFSFVIASLTIIEIIAPYVFYPGAPNPGPLYLAFGNSAYLSHLLLILIFPALYLFLSVKGKKCFVALIPLLSLYGALALLAIEDAITAFGLAMVFLIFVSVYLYRKKAIISFMVK